MKNSEYQAEFAKATALAESGDHAGAAHIFERLLHYELPSLDKSMICVNLATLNGKMGQERKALTWFNAAIDHENNERIFAAMQKAAYLHGLGRIDECRKVMEGILQRSNLTPQDRAGVEHNLEILGADREGRPRRG